MQSRAKRGWRPRCRGTRQRWQLRRPGWTRCMVRPRCRWHAAARQDAGRCKGCGMACCHAVQAGSATMPCEERPHHPCCTHPPFLGLAYNAHPAGEVSAAAERHSSVLRDLDTAHQQTAVVAAHLLQARRDTAEMRDAHAAEKAAAEQLAAQLQVGRWVVPALAWAIALRNQVETLLATPVACRPHAPSTQSQLPELNALDVPCCCRTPTHSCRQCRCYWSARAQRLCLLVPLRARRLAARWRGCVRRQTQLAKRPPCSRWWPTAGSGTRW